MIGTVPPAPQNPIYPRNFGGPQGLILTRKGDEEFAIIDFQRLHATVVGVAHTGRDRVGISVDAPDFLIIQRAEILAQHVPNLYDAIKSGAPITEKMIHAYEAAIRH